MYIYKLLQFYKYLVTQFLRISACYVGLCLKPLKYKLYGENQTVPIVNVIDLTVFPIV